MIWTEFFGDFGVYDVTLTLPRGFVLGATGRQESKTENPDGSDSYRFVQEDVHDFAWTASRRFLERRARFDDAGYPPVEIRLLLQPEHAHLGQRYLEATKIALRTYGTWSAPYPYPQITVVDPAWGSASGGMEYPTLFTGGASVLAPPELQSPEGVTIHEAGHQFWYGLVTKNHSRRKNMKKFMLVTLVTVLALSVFSAAGAVSKASADESKVLEFNTMTGVPRPYTGATNAIRGVPGGGLPWVIEFGKGKLSPEGSVDVLVKGLVFDPNDQAVIDRGLAGINTVPNFKVIVSCLSKDATGAAVTVNVSMGLFPADTAGNAHIKDMIALPSPCIAPILFVTSATGSWFAVTGF